LRSYDTIPNAPLLVVRPHPAEDHAIWEVRLRGLNRVKVVYENDVSGWLYACRMLVHRGCTTGVQARVGGIPTFFWAPENRSLETNSLPYQVSAKIASLSEVVEHWENPLAAMAALNISKYHLELNQGLSINRIFDEVDSLNVTPTLPGQFRTRKRISMNLKAMRQRIIASNTYLTERFANMRRLRMQQNGFHADELLDYLAKAFPKNNYMVRQVAPDLISVQSVPAKS